MTWQPATSAPSPAALSRAAVDRDAATRADPAALERAWAAGQVLVVHEGRTLVSERPGLVLLPAAAAPAGDRLYLGRDAQAAYFAVDAALPVLSGVRAAGLREVGALLDDRDAGLLVHAVGLANWHATHRHCPRCGAVTEPDRGGAIRRCTQEGSEHFPRTDPAVIMLVTDGADRCVLGRQPSWPPGRFSTLAGFVEPGETAEQAVAREVAEETGLAVHEVAYRGSQPWPFPASLMLAFTARCDGDAQPQPVDGELAEAGWFHREELRSGAVLLPPRVSIAHRLITSWLAG